MKTKFKVQWGIPVKLITGIATLVIIIGEYYLITDALHTKELITIIVAAGLLVLLGYFISASPSFIELNETEITLHRLKGNLTIPLNRITEIKPYKPDKSELRYFGSGGWFGFIGSFSNATIGRYQSYVGDYAQAFLIVTKEDKKYVFSCENPEELIRFVQIHK
ncbi:MAG: PH domain-containing protein [Dysgonamonadaceae bacterium]|jgi:hypothetical protein|nr:PH domain-containing protein [Dysgonamonadaceae bacterium]